METEDLTPEERARMEAEALKLKLIAEHGALIHVSEDSPLSAQMELAWLNHIANYEQLCKDAGEAPVYEEIGKPAYKKTEDIPEEEIEEHLNQLLQVMDESGIALDFDDDEPANDIYRFITEELFWIQVNRYKGPEGEKGYRCFDYYEFHPNHLKDVTRYTEEYLTTLFKKPDWEGKYLHYTHHKTVIVNGNELALPDYSACISAFKEKYPIGLFKEWRIEQVNMDLEEERASVKAIITIMDREFPFFITFLLDYYWCICELKFELLRASRFSSTSDV